MSDNLAENIAQKALRVSWWDTVTAARRVAEYAAELIKELEADNKALRRVIADVVNSTGDDPEIMAASRAEWAARAFTAEAKLAKAREEGFWAGRSCGGAKKEIDATLAELKGQK